MAFVSLPIVASLLVHAAPLPDAVGIVTAPDGRRCVATLVAPDRAITAGTCADGSGATLQLGDERIAIAHVHHDARMDLAVVALAHPAVVVPIGVLDHDALDRVATAVGDGLPGTALLNEHPVHGLVLAGIVDAEGRDIPTSDILTFEPRVQREGMFSGDAGEVLMVTMLVAAGVGYVAQNNGCEGAPVGQLLGLLGALAVLVLLACPRGLEARG